MNTATATRITPALVNVGVMSKEQLDIILAQFSDFKNAYVQRGEGVIQVKNHHGEIALSAANIDLRLWHVRAADGLIVKG